MYDWEHYVVHALLWLVMQVIIYGKDNIKVNKN